jgi:cystathionine beta-synthase
VVQEERFRNCKILEEQNPNIKILAVDAFGSLLKKYHETKEFDGMKYPYR